MSEVVSCIENVNVYLNSLFHSEQQGKHHFISVIHVWDYMQNVWFEYLLRFILPFCFLDIINNANASEQ